MTELIQAAREAASALAKLASAVRIVQVHTKQEVPASKRLRVQWLCRDCGLIWSWAPWVPGGAPWVPGGHGQFCPTCHRMGRVSVGVDEPFPKATEESV